MTREAPIALYLDADACPVKEEAYKVALRHGVAVYVVANAPIAVPRDGAEAALPAIAAALTAACDQADALAA